MFWATTARVSTLGLLAGTLACSQVLGFKRGKLRATSSGAVNLVSPDSGVEIPDAGPPLPLGTSRSGAPPARSNDAQPDDGPGSVSEAESALNVPGNSNDTPEPGVLPDTSSLALNSSANTGLVSPSAGTTASAATTSSTSSSAPRASVAPSNPSAPSASVALSNSTPASSSAAPSSSATVVPSAVPTVECTTNNACTGSSKGPFCDVAPGKCVQCLQGPDCSATLACSAGVCQSGSLCITDKDCARGCSSQHTCVNCAEPVGAICGSKHPVNEQAKVYKLTHALQLDGSGAEFCEIPPFLWSFTEGTAMFGSGSNVASVRFAWTDSAFAAFIDVDDPSGVYTRDNSLFAWAGDGATLYLYADTLAPSGAFVPAGPFNGTTEGVQLSLAPPSTAFPSGYGTRMYWTLESGAYVQHSEALTAGVSGSSNAVQFVTVKTTKGYAIELRVPWTALGASMAPRKMGLALGLSEATAQSVSQATSAGDARVGLVEMYRRNPPVNAPNCAGTPYCNNSSWCPVDLLTLP